MESSRPHDADRASELLTRIIPKTVVLLEWVSPAYLALVKAPLLRASAAYSPLKGIG